MNKDERQPDQENLLRLVQQGVMRRLRVAAPGIVEWVDLAKNTCSVQCAIQYPSLTQTGETVLSAVKPFVDVPIVYMGGGGLTATFPVTVGDEVLVVFCDQDIDAWWQSGDIQPPASTRMHSHSDAIAIPGIRSQPRVLENVSNTSAQLRTEDGTAYIELTNAGVINIVGPVNVTGALTVVGAMATTGTLKNNGVDVGSDHVHVSGAEGSDTGTPRMGP